MTGPQESMSAHLHDVIIIGAGPCGLATAARLCEQTPSALFTDEEHARYHWINKHGKQLSVKNSRTGRLRPAETSRKRPYDMLVLDGASDQWLGNWARLFQTFDISHLRSPMFFHVDPADRDSLLAHTHVHGRAGELREICNCVGKEVSKHKRKESLKKRGMSARATLEIDERDRKDYYTPSTSLFADHCEDVIKRYGLNEDLVRNESVQDIDFGRLNTCAGSIDAFTVRTAQCVHHARTVVLAVGAGCKPAMPADMHLCMSRAIGYVADGQLEGACHSMQIRQFPDPSVMKKVKAGKSTNVLVVGGGLTSAQLSNLAIRRGVTKVWHVMRSGYKIKPFDVDLRWMGKFRNHEKASFWSADSDESRSEAIQHARGGGSINPPYARILRKRISEGRVSLLEHTTITPHQFDSQAGTWSVKAEPAHPELEQVYFDYIYFATGVAADYTKIPCLQTMLAKYPLHGHGGMPCLGEDLEWWGHNASANSVMKKGESPDWQDTNYSTGSTIVGSLEGDDDGDGGSHVRIPLFIAGRLAGLRLGPGAGNLEGARMGAERIALGIQEYLADAGVGGVGGGGGGVGSSGAENKRSNQNKKAPTGTAAHAGPGPGAGPRTDNGNADDHHYNNNNNNNNNNNDNVEATATRHRYHRYRYAAGLGSRFDSLSQDLDVDRNRNQNPDLDNMAFEDLFDGEDD